MSRLEGVKKVAYFLERLVGGRAPVVFSRLARLALCDFYSFLFQGQGQARFGKTQELEAKRGGFGGGTSPGDHSRKEQGKKLGSQCCKFWFLCSAAVTTAGRSAENKLICESIRDGVKNFKEKKQVIRATNTLGRFQLPRRSLRQASRETRKASCAADQAVGHPIEKRFWGSKLN